MTSNTVASTEVRGQKIPIDTLRRGRGPLCRRRYGTHCFSFFLLPMLLGISSVPRLSILFPVFILRSFAELVPRLFWRSFAANSHGIEVGLGNRLSSTPFSSSLSFLAQDAPAVIGLPANTTMSQSTQRCRRLKLKRWPT